MRKTRAAEDSKSHLVAMRRWLHQHPELSFHECETARYIANELERLGIPYEYGGEGSAVIARLQTDPAGPGVALRAEMDALPGHETTGAPYASVNEGAMHACGHGAHIAMVLAAAASLASSPPRGNVVFVFQPAEESGGGARTAISEGALQGVDSIFAGHVTHEYETGKIMVAEGVVTSQSDRFVFEITGKGGHGARPHEAIDAVVIAGFLITAVQTLVSREVNPLHPSVVTIGSVHAGSAPNVIAEEAILAGSIRTTTEEIREHIHRGLRRMADAIGELHNAEVSVVIDEGYPPVINDPGATGLARTAAGLVVGPQGLVKMEHPSMGSEDFAYFLQKIPGSFVRFGARRSGWEPIPLHSPSFDIDEDVLPIGAEYFDRVARIALEHQGVR